MPDVLTASWMRLAAALSREPVPAPSRVFHLSRSASSPSEEMVAHVCERGARSRARRFRSDEAGDQPDDRADSPNHQDADD